MKYIRFFTNGLLVASVCFALGSCSDEDFLDLEQNKTQNEQTTHTIPMEFVGDVVGFDQQSNGVKVQTRTTTSSWTNGDKIYITFYNGSNIVPGEATYNSSSGWSVSYDGNLATGSNLKCEARYFVNATFSSSSLVSLNSNTEIYEDLNGTYAYNNGSLTVQASLTPKTGRIRFTGTSGAKIYTTGISVYTTFAPAINQFSTSNAMITSTVASNGSTPYIYGTFTDSDRNIGLVGSDFAYTRTCTSDMLKVGESGYMAIPSESSHNNWRTGLYVKASGVEFKMIPVSGYSGGFYLIGETEVTEALYYSINGTSSSSQKPISSISYYSALSCIEKINNQTKLNFSIPTSDQWDYAAKGGNQSQNYTYSGSNTPDDVAWYSENTDTKRNVKTKAPNELGIYDMTGNVFEMTLTRDAYYYCVGGSYNSDSKILEADCKICGTEASYSDVGFRFILTCQ
ncbi:MAG: SUMF1/EgtB/PvdO family nonheme iron enzyme [Bacteroidaceae bacterium]|nr:SUMF1/EgtB/PvdO family nonheme iron enzyme [Bacteroidaceae bacterium]